MEKIIKLAFTDFKLIFRDPSLYTFLFLPTLLFAMIIWLVPYLVERFDFLEPYFTLILAVCVIENTQMFCFISGMVLIDEKESNVATVYGIVPFNTLQFLMSRFLFPFFFTVLLNVTLLVVQPFYYIDWFSILAVSLLAALVVPLYALTLNIIAKNRMEGLVYVKALNIIVLIPLTAFFVPEGWAHLFGVIPTYWIFHSIDNITHGHAAGWTLGIGFVFFVALTWFVSNEFVKKHFV
jgi:fluoroquinolone transport system permease protein